MACQHIGGSAPETLEGTGMHPLLYAHHLWLGSSGLDITPCLWLKGCPSGNVEPVLAHLSTAASCLEK